MNVELAWLCYSNSNNSGDPLSFSKQKKKQQTGRPKKIQLIFQEHSHVSLVKDAGFPQDNLALVEKKTSFLQ